MAIKTNTQNTYSLKGIREELSDIISNISPTQTPFMTAAGSGDCKSVFFEWQQDSLASPDATNAQLEGDDVDSVGYDAVTPTVRVGNYCQISRKSVVISGTADQVKKAGRGKEIAYQIAKKAKELKRDMETIAIGTNQACVSGGDAVARKTGTMLAWTKTNVSKGGGAGANPSYTTTPNATRTDGTQRNLTEALVKAVCQQVFTSGGDPSLLMFNAVNKQNMSAIATGISTRYQQTNGKAATIVGAADVYVSDFGDLKIVPNRFQRERDGWVIDPDMVSLVFLRSYRTEDLGKTGDASKKLLLCEWGLRVENEAGIGLVADLNTSLQ